MRGLLEAVAAGNDRGALPAHPAGELPPIAGLQRTAMCASAAGLAGVVVASAATMGMLIAIADGTVGWTQPATVAVAALIGALAPYDADTAFTMVRNRLGDAAGPTRATVTTAPAP